MNYKGYVIYKRADDNVSVKFRDGTTEVFSNVKTARKHITIECNALKFKQS